MPHEPKQKKGPQNQPKKPILPQIKAPKGGMWRTVVLAILIFLAITSIYSYFADQAIAPQTISISQLADDINAGKVASINVSGDSVVATYIATSTNATSSAATSTAGTVTTVATSTGSTTAAASVGNQIKKATTKEADTPITETLVNYGVSPAKLAAVQIDIDNGSSSWLFWIENIAPLVFSVLMVILIIWFFTRQIRGAGMQAMSFGQSKARMINPNDKNQRVTFKDVAGAKEAKEELSEIVDFLKNPKKFLDIGASIPKGILLMGAPGTGKTLLARAVAGEAGVAFFSISGSEFVEMFVGVGASRVRDLFAMAKEAAPAIIFIDEIDAVGRARGSGVGGGNDEREQTLNQILVEMDGFEPNEKVIIMAATNRPDVLDPAILRPGRFDRRVTIDLPDRKDREEILKIHARNKPFAEDLNISIIAERTPGFSGADLYSLMNEAAILAARENRTKVAQFDLIRAIEKVMLGPERKSHILSKAEKKITAYHEAGHAIVSSVLPFADPVHKISIISRGRAAGYTLHLPLEDRKLQSKREFLDDIAVSLAGYVTEKMIFGDVTTGPSNDLQVSTALARDMVTKYGMSDKLGALAFEGNGGRAMFGKGLEDKDYSEKVSSDIDGEVSRIMSEALAKAEKILTDYRKVLDIVALRLIEVENIERDAYEAIIVANGIPLKKKLAPEETVLDLEIK